MTDNRKHPRKAVEGEVDFQPLDRDGRGEGAPVAARFRDVSLGGMFIETPAPPAYGAAVRLSLLLPGMKEEASIDAVVRWATRAGMGVQFGRMGARETHALTLLLAGK